MTKRYTTDWYSIGRIKANQLQRKIAEALPEQWRGRIGMLAASVKADSDVPVWLQDTATIEKLTTFDKSHGGARLWCMSDAEVCAMAREVSDKMQSWLGGGPLHYKNDSDEAARGGENWHILPIAEKLYIVGQCCKTLGIEPPKGWIACTDNESGGVIARAQSENWWRRALRKRVARVVEHGAIKLGVVNRLEGAYASDYAVTERKQQLARNAAVLQKSIYKNEAGQCYRLSELAALSVANPDNRRDELMTRIRGAEEYADNAGHAGLFVTLTTPSKYHAVMSKARDESRKLLINPKYDNALTPRDAQLWLREKWARVRADLGRAGVKMYGVRVAEPHHDATPHWHALLWFDGQDALKTAIESIRRHWLSEDGQELGAQKNRVNIKRMEFGKAAGYVAKYIAKNVGGSVNVDGHTDGGKPVNTGGVRGVERVGAWAARWGIRQFQSFGLPPIGVWRKLRGVDAGQVEAARVNGDWDAWRAWGAAHRQGDIKADFKRYIDAMGGVCRGRGEWPLAVAMRSEPNCKNEYGESITRKTAVGVEVVRSGRWLVSKTQVWSRVCLDTLGAAGAAALAVGDSGGTPAPWTRFNNCTARLGGTLRAALLQLRGEPWHVSSADFVQPARC